MEEAVFIDAVRTPMGRSKGGMFRNVRAENLSAILINELLNRYPELNPEDGGCNLGLCKPDQRTGF